MYIRLFKTAIGACLLAVNSITYAVGILPSLTINISTEIVQMDLTGTGVLPLGPGYSEVLSQVDFSESATLTSNGLTSLFIDLNTETGTVSSSFNFFLDMTLTDIDGSNSYAAGLGNQILIAAVATKPLSATVSGDVSFDGITGEAIVSNLTQNAPQIERALGVDVNGNMVDDSIFYSLLNLTTIVEALDFDAFDLLSANTTIDPVTGDIIFDVVGSATLTATSLTMDGSVADTLTDPPFTLELIGTISTPQAVPEPATMALVLAGMLMSVRRRVVD